MVLPIYLYGSKVIREKALEVNIESDSKEDLNVLLDDMYETMKKADGCGLAAPQVGVSKRLLIVDGADVTEIHPECEGFFRKMINPIIVNASEETSTYSEGCLSLPNVDAEIVRPKSVTVRYFDEHFQQKEEFFDNYVARMVLHEMDHLDGIVFIDRATPIRKKLVSGKLHGISKGCVNTRYKVKLEN